LVLVFYLSGVFALKLQELCNVAIQAGIEADPPAPRCHRTKQSACRGGMFGIQTDKKAALMFPV
jgi:hypothetical protein